MVDAADMIDERSEAQRPMLIGELAQASGVTVRTLRHYERLELVIPAARGENGYRRYGRAEVARLYRVRALKALGLSLKEIASVMSSDEPPGELQTLVIRHLVHVRSQQAALSSLENRLSLLLDTLTRSDQAPTHQVLAAMGEMMSLDRALKHDYSRQAARYDRSRGVSADVVSAVLDVLEDVRGRQLLDVGGGTGNYAAALRDDGWAPTVLDASPYMRGQAEAKGLPVIAGDATMLPLADESYDAVTMISMLHQVGDWHRALSEACRVLRPGGQLVVMGLAAEHLREVTWAYDLFPSMRTFALPARPSLAEMQAALPGAETVPIWFSDLADASIGALCAHPEAMLDAGYRRQTSSSSVWSATTQVSSRPAWRRCAAGCETATALNVSEPPRASGSATPRSSVGERLRRPVRSGRGSSRMTQGTRNEIGRCADRRPLRSDKPGPACVPAATLRDRGGRCRLSG